MKVKPIIPIILLLLSLIATIISTRVSADFIQTINPDLMIYASIAIFIGITSFIALYALLNTRKKTHRLTALFAYLIATTMSVATIYQQIESPNVNLENKERSDKVEQINAQIETLQQLNKIASSNIARLSNDLASSKYKTRDKANIRDYKKEINRRNQEINQQQLLLPIAQDQSSTVFNINFLHLFYACIWDCFALFMQLFARFLRQSKRDQQSDELNQYTQTLARLEALSREASVSATNLLRRNAEAQNLNQSLEQHSASQSKRLTSFDQQVQLMTQEKEQLISIIDTAKQQYSQLNAENKKASKQQAELLKLKDELNITTQHCINTVNQSSESLNKDQQILQDNQAQLKRIKGDVLKINSTSQQYLSDLRAATKHLNKSMLDADKKEAKLLHSSHKKFNEFNQSMNELDKRFVKSNQSMDSINEQSIQLNGLMKQSTGDIADINQQLNESNGIINERFNGFNNAVDRLNKRFVKSNQSMDSINEQSIQLNGLMKQSTGDIADINQQLNESNGIINERFNGFNNAVDRLNKRFVKSNQSMDSINEKMNEMNGFNGMNESSNGFNQSSHKNIQTNETGFEKLNALTNDNEILVAIRLLEQGKISRSEQGYYTAKSITKSTGIALTKIKVFKEIAQRLGLLAAKKGNSGMVYIDPPSTAQILLFNKKAGL